MKEDLSLKAADEARKKTERALARYRITPGRIAKGLSEELDATEVKVFHDKASGTIIYSDPLIAHQARLKAIELCIALLQMKPAEKVDMNHTGTVDMTGGLLTDLEASGRLLYLIDQAKKRKNAGSDGKKTD